MVFNGESSIVMPSLLPWTMTFWPQNLISSSLSPTTPKL